MSQLNFETVVPVLPIGKFSAYAIIPAFDYGAPVWRGASEIVTQFNYSASKNFILRNLPTKPSPYPAPNYCPIIAYRTGIIKTRFKLWQDVDEVLQEVPWYDGNIIKKNFSIEIWNCNNQARVTNPVTFNLYLSIRRTPPDMSNPVDYADPASYIEVLQPSIVIPSNIGTPVDLGSDVMWLDNP